MKLPRVVFPGSVPMSLMAAAATVAVGLAACSGRDDLVSPEAAASGELAAAAARADGFGTGGFGVGGFAAGAVYVQTNAAASNEVLRFPRAANGTLGTPTAFGTGGLGSGDALGNQGALALAGGGRLLYVVNAGSDEVSGFRVRGGGPGGGLELIGTWASGGDLPISLALTGRYLYVLHDGVETKVTGFAVDPRGGLHPIPGATRPLPNATPDAAQVAASPDGRWLVVTEKAANAIVTFPIRANGSLGSAVETPSAGATPFGFAFDGRGALIVSEAAGGAADASSLSSYRHDAGAWDVVTASAKTTETAACWVAVSPDGRYVYTTNAGSGTISGYAIGHNGSLRLLDADGVTAVTGVGPADLAFSRDGRYLYALNGGGHSLSVFRAASDGGLVPVATVAGLPVTANGLVVE